MKINYVDINGIEPYKDNPRKNKNAINAVKTSIERYGFKVPIVVDKNNVIIAGHTRYEAAKKIGLQQVPVIVASDLSDEAAKAYRLADNKTAELATWDENKLAKELHDLDTNILKDIGFELVESEDLEVFSDFAFKKHNSDHVSIKLNFTHDDFEIVKKIIKKEGKNYISKKLIELCEVI